MIKKCVICNVEFKMKYNSTGKYCSYKCANLGRTNRIDKECAVCNKKFDDHSAGVKKYCSKECYYKMKKIRGDKVEWTDGMRERMSERMSGDKNPGYGKPSKLKGIKRPDISGEKHPNYIRGYYLNKEGYKIIGKRTRLHRKIVENFIGRELMEEEIIHHIDGDKQNNNIENLKIVSRKEHIEIHRNEITEGKRK